MSAETTLYVAVLLLLFDKGVTNGSEGDLVVIVATGRGGLPNVLSEAVAVADTLFSSH